MEIIGFVASFFAGLLALAIVIYFVYSPFALLVALFNPKAVLDDKKPQTRARALKAYGVPSVIMILIAATSLSSIPDSSQVIKEVKTHASSNFRETSNSTKEHSSSSKTKVSTSAKLAEKKPAIAEPSWIKFRADRAIKIEGIKEIDRISPKNEFYSAVEPQGGKLFIAGFAIKNTGIKSGNSFWSNYQLVDNKGRQYDEISDFSEQLTIDSWLEEAGFKKPGSQLFPGQEIKVFKVFRISPDAEELHLSINNKMIS